jgi:hypothetical protein
VADNLEVVVRTSPLVISNPGVEVVKVTGPTKPESAANVALKAELAATSVDPELGDACRMESAETTNEYDHVPVSGGLLPSASLPEIA